MSEADQPVPMEVSEPTQSSTPLSSPTLKTIGSPMSTRSNNEGKIAKKLFTPEAEKDNSISKASEAKTPQVKEKSKSPEKSSKTPVASSKKAPSSSKKTPSSSTKTPTTDKKKRQSIGSVKKKRQELLEKEKQILETLANLKKEKGRVQGRINLLAQREKVKFPVKDELIEQLDPTGKPPLPIPLAHTDLSEDIPERYVHDAVGVWDFLNMFSKQLGVNTIGWEDFVVTLKYAEKNTQALNDLFICLLKLLLSDTAQCTKLTASLPKHIYFAHKLLELDAAVENRRESILPPLPQRSGALTYNQYDSEYKGLAFLPRKLSSDMVDNLRYPLLLRGIVLRLDPVKRLRKALGEVVGVLQDTNNTPGAAGGFVFAGLDFESDAVLEEWLKVNRMFWHEEDANGKGEGSESLPPVTPFKSRGGEECEGDGPNTPSLSSLYPAPLTRAVMQRINTPKISSRSQKISYPNRDAIFSITAEVLGQVADVYSAAKLLENNEIFMLPVYAKIVLLKSLVDACFDTVRIREMMERHAEERNNVFVRMNKEDKEREKEKKEAREKMRAEAIERCRQLNYAKKSAKKKGAAAAAGIQSKAYDPTPDQLASMVDELMVLEHYGVDGVVEEEEDGEGGQEGEKNGEEGGEDQGEEDLEGRRKRPRRMAPSQVQAVREKRDGGERLEYALERNSERELKSAIRFAERGGHRFSQGKQTLVTRKLFLAYKALKDLEDRNKAEREAAAREEAMTGCFVRTEPLGSDRYGDVYYRFKGEGDRVFKMSLVKQPEADKRQGINPLTDTDPESLPLKQLYLRRPALTTRRWCVYSSVSELFRLCEALDERGEREGALKRSLLDIYRPQPPAGGVEYLTEGSEYIGRRVKRKFGKKVVVGKVVGWFPPGEAEENMEVEKVEGEVDKDEGAREDEEEEGTRAKKRSEEDPPLWRILHTDGDEEDLELHELLPCLVDEGEGSQDNKPKAQSSKRTSKEKDDDDEEAEMDDEQSEEEEGVGDLEETLPDILRLSSGFMNRSHRVGANGTGGGVDGLNVEALRFCGNISSTLTKGGLKEGVYGEVRALLTGVLKARFKSEGNGLSEVSEGLIQLEDGLHSLQCVPDKRDAEQAEREREECAKAWQGARTEMEKEGWVFAAPSSEQQGDLQAEQGAGLDYSLLGQRVRRFFKRFGVSDGTIIAVLPPAANGEEALYRIRHDDGDEEDLEVDGANRAVKHFQANANPLQLRAAGDVASDSEDSESEDEEEEASKDKAEDVHDMFDNMRLWPTGEVRSRWKNGVLACTNTSELAWALYALEVQTWQFGLLSSTSPSDDYLGSSSTPSLMFNPPVERAGERRVAGVGGRGGAWAAAATMKGAKKGGGDTKAKNQREREINYKDDEDEPVFPTRRAARREGRVSYKESSSEEESQASSSEDDEEGAGRSRRTRSAGTRRQPSRNSSMNSLADEDGERVSNTGRPTRGAALRVGSYAV